MKTQVTWDTLKRELSVRFAKISDAQHAFMLLRQVKQERHEHVQIYAESSLSIAEQEYKGVQDALVTEGQLVGFFIDGRYSDRLKLQVMRDNPPNMQNAINYAREDFSCDQEKLILLLSVMSGNQWKVYRVKRVAKRDD